MSQPVLLLVEDDELVRAITADLLTEMGYAVRAAETAADALAALDDTVDVLVTDIRLPDADRAGAGARGARACAGHRGRDRHGRFGRGGRRRLAHEAV